MSEILDRALDNEKNASIVKLNSGKIKKTKENILNELNLNKKEQGILLKKLKDYRYVDEMPDIEFGNYIRWISIKNAINIKLTNGGHIIGIEILSDGVHIRCRNNMNRIFQIRMDENLIFQKLTEQEIILLKVVDYLER